MYEVEREKSTFGAETFPVHSLVRSLFRVT
jgi:hypothetical protein